MIGDFEFEVLSEVLRLNGDGYAVPISEKLTEERGKRVQLGTVHGTLARLKDKGFVSSRLGDPLPERGGRARRYYKITISGMEARKARLEQIEQVYSEALGWGSISS